MRYPLQILCLLLLTAACSKPNNIEVIAESPKQWLLPAVLHEASGLAIADDTAVYLHNDEYADIFRFDLQSGAVTRIASISRPAIEDDFEGIAINEGLLYLMTSRGQIYVIDDVEPNMTDQVVGAQRISTGLRKRCEFEGLHYLDGKLLMPCKETKKKTDKKQLVVFAFDLATQETDKFFSIDIGDIDKIKRAAPTAFDATETHYYLVSDDHLLEIDRMSLETQSYRLNLDLHRQVEGLAIMPDGTFVLVEDNRRGLARITKYANLDELISLNR